MNKKCKDTDIKNTKIKGEIERERERERERAKEEERIE